MHVPDEGYVERMVRHGCGTHQKTSAKLQANSGNEHPLFKRLDVEIQNLELILNF
jgi:hypothetical protein